MWTMCGFVSVFARCFERGLSVCHCVDLFVFLIIYVIFRAVRVLKPLEIYDGYLLFFVSACQDFIKIAAIQAQ